MADPSRSPTLVDPSRAPPAALPASALSAALKPSVGVPEAALLVRGHDFGECQPRRAAETAQPNGRRSGEGGRGEGGAGLGPPQSDASAEASARDALGEAHVAARATQPGGAKAGERRGGGSPVDYSALMRSLLSTGFQATALGQAMAVVNKMLDWRLSDEPVASDAAEGEREPAFRASTRCKVFLGFTSNLMSSGLREAFTFLAKHRMVDVIVTTAGGIEEDLIKCLGPTVVGDFSLPGKQLRSQGLNRIGNLLVPNNNYCAFEDWVMPLLDECLKDQTEQGYKWTPSKLIDRLGARINNESSVLYWAHKKSIPVFCPSITDGSLGDMLYFHSYRNPGLIIDVVEDIRCMNNEAVHATPRKTGIVILGGGVPKHHICNANMFRNGADFAVYINTAAEFDGSDSGARPDEAISWGKIKGDAMSVKVHCDATIAFPLLVAETFAQRVSAFDDGVYSA